jgi:hypothetical protein
MSEGQLDSRSIELYLDLMKQVLSASIYEESAWKAKEPNGAHSRFLTSPVSSARGYFMDAVIRALRKRAILLVDMHAYDASAREQGKDWPLFAYTMVGHLRLQNVQFCVQDALRNGIPGDLIETGAWRGGTTIFMRAILKAHGVTDRKVWVADSFEGLPAPKDAKDGWDLSGVDFLKVSLEKVKSNFDRFGLLDDQVEFLKGWFCDTLPTAPIEKLAVLRLDGDLYSSTMDALQNLYHRVSEGGYVIVDDYYSWPACREAVTDFLRANSLKPEIRAIDRGGAFWQVTKALPRH